MASQLTHTDQNHMSGNGHRTKSKFSKLLSLLGVKNAATLKESVEEVIEEHEGENPEEQEEKILLRNVLSFNELDVEDIMIPRADIVSVDYDITLKELKTLLADNVHTRFPVCNGKLDDIAGFIHLKDLLPIIGGDKSFKIDTIMRQALFVPPSMRVSALLMKMQISHVHMAIVVDEFGGTCGLVTLEDVVEEIVGEIADEHDVVGDIMFHKIRNDLYEASARVSIEELEQKLETTFAEEEHAEDFDTLGGLIFFLLGRIPTKGEIVTHTNGYEFEITDADIRKIKRVLIRKSS